MTRGPQLSGFLGDITMTQVGGEPRGQFHMDMKHGETPAKTGQFKPRGKRRASAWIWGCLLTPGGADPRQLPAPGGEEQRASQGRVLSTLPGGLGRERLGNMSEEHRRTELLRSREEFQEVSGTAMLGRSQGRLRTGSAPACLFRGL